MNTLARKLRRDLWQALGRVISIIGILTVGVACFVEMRSCYFNLRDAKQNYYEFCRMADFSIELKKAPLAELARLTEFAEVVDIRPRIQFFATVDLENQPELLNGQVLSLPDRRQAVINDIALKRGSYFTETRDNEVIVNDAFARRHGLRPGQWIHLILNNRRQELMIVGTALSSEFVYLVGPGAITPDPDHFGVFYLKQTFAEEVFDFEGAANQVLGRLASNARERPDDFLRRAEQLLSAYGVLTTTPRKDQASNRFISEEIDGLATFASILPTIFLAVAAIVLNVLMSRMIEQQRTIVGTLKAVGYGDLQVFWHYLQFGLLIGTISGVLGCAAGYGLAGWLTGIYGQFYEFPNLANRFYADTMLQGLCISVGCAVLGTLHGARVVLRLNPAAAMRPKPPVQGGEILLERLGWFWSRLGFRWRTVLRSAVRNRFRTVAGMFAAAMGTAILLCGLMMEASMLHLIDFQFNRIQRSDVDLAFKDERGVESLLEARGLVGVDHAEPLLEVVCTMIHGPYQRRGAITGLLGDARLTIPRDEAGEPIRIPTVGLCMTRTLADILHVAPGDEIVIRPVRGERRDIVVPVTAIADTYLGLSVYADFHYLNRLVGEEFAVSGIQLQCDTSPRGMRDLHRELKRLPAIQSVSARRTRIQNLMDTVIDTQQTFIGVLIIFAGVIFFGSVMNSSLISLAERQREVATFRVLGYSPWQIGGLFLRETLLVNMIGTLLGLPAGYYLSVGISYAYNNELFRVAVSSPPRVWTITLILSAVFSLLAHGVVQRSIHKLDWLDALKVRE